MDVVGFHVDSEDELYDEIERRDNELAKAGRLRIYEVTKAAKTGTACRCPSCGKTFTKKSYQQAFCSNKGRNNCKDNFWNRASDDRSNRASFFASRR